MRIQVRLNLGDARLEGSFTGNLRIVEGCVKPTNMFQTATLQLAHTPSNFRLDLSYNATTQALTGTVQKPDGTNVAHIGEASTLGLPDLGDVYIVRYTDNTFETINSLLGIED